MKTLKKNQQKNLSKYTMVILGFYKECKKSLILKIG